jgi:hypothetical protein
MPFEHLGRVVVVVVSVESAWELQVIKRDLHSWLSFVAKTRRHSRGGVWVGGGALLLSFVLMTMRKPKISMP